MEKKKAKKSQILFKLCQMFHVPSCMLLFCGVSLSLYKYHIPWWRAICYSLPFVFAAMGCFALNAYYDYEKDVINKPYRILPMGLIRKRSILVIGNAIFILAMIAIVVAEDIKELVMYIFVITAAYVYGKFIDYISKIKAFYTAIILTFPVLFVVVKCRLDMDITVLFVAVVCYISGKELMMDIYDMEGDKSVGQYTLPVCLGENIIFVLSTILQIISIVLFLFCLHVGYIVTVACCVGLGICYYGWTREIRVWRRYIIYLLWIPLMVELMVTI